MDGPTEDNPMIYTVECSFADPAREADWNDFYSLDKLPALISVAGFHTSQRFKASGAGCPAYLALHSIDDVDVLFGEAYRRKGGGDFAGWRQHITDWRRNLYDGLDRAPSVAQDEVLSLSVAGPDAMIALGLTPHELRAVALDKAPQRRWLATLNRSRLPGFDGAREGVQLYAPMTAQLTPAGVAATPARQV